MSSVRSRKRRQAQRNDVQPEEQVLAELALLNEVAKVAMRRGDDAHVGADCGAAADGHVFALLQDTKQPRLRLHRHVADLVEEQGAALGLLEASGLTVDRAGEGALLVTEQLRFDELAGNRRHVDGDERTLAAPAEIVEHPGDQLLAASRFARDENREIALRQASEHPVDVLHRRRAADERQILRLLRCFAQRRSGGFLTQSARRNRDQLVEVERLRQIVVGAELGGGDRRHDGVAWRS